LKAEPFDSLQFWFDIQECRCQPPISLIGVVPALDISGALCHHRVEGFDTVGGAKGLLELRHQSQAMQSEGSFEAFFQAVQGADAFINAKEGLRASSAALAAL
jgi:hypothetical protein